VESSRWVQTTAWPWRWHPYAKTIRHNLDRVIPFQNNDHTFKSMQPFWRHSGLKYNAFAAIEGLYWNHCNMCEHVSISKLSSYLSLNNCTNDFVVGCHRSQHRFIIWKGEYNFFTFFNVSTPKRLERSTWGETRSGVLGKPIPILLIVLLTLDIL